MVTALGDFRGVGRARANVAGSAGLLAQLGVGAAEGRPPGRRRGREDGVGNPSLDLYELRHFCASYLLNDLDLHAEDVAAQLGHTDGGVLVQRLYGHPSTELAGKRAHEAHRRPIVLPLRPGKELGEG